MATADLDFNLRIKGTPEEITALLGIMREYTDGKDGVYFSMTSVDIDGTVFRFPLTAADDEEFLNAVRSCSKPVDIHSCGPFGKYGMLNDVDIFRDMAEAAPNAEFTGSIDGFAGYADQSLSARLENGKLRISTFYLSDDVRGEAAYDYATTCLPYDKFIELFRLDADEFTDEKYEELMGNEISCSDSPAEFFEETEYEEFLELLEADCPIDEDEYSEIVEQLAELDCIPFEEFLEENDYADCENFVYDPIEKKYLEASGSVMKSNTAYSANEEIRAYLDSIGRPSDDDTIAALSVEDVYAIMAGVYGKDEDEDE